MVLRFAVSFSNAGFMGLPLGGGHCGQQGRDVRPLFIVVFNIFCWTYGYSMIESGARAWFPEGALFNPGIIGLLLNLPSPFGFHLPAVITGAGGFSRT